MPNINNKETQAAVPNTASDDAQISAGNYSQKAKSLFQGKFKENVQKANTPESVKKTASVEPVNEKKPETKEPEYEGQQTEKLFSIKDLTTNLTPTKVIKLIGLLIGVLMIGAALYVRFIRRTPVRNIPTMVNVPTPSYSPYERYKPSIYAEDPNFMEINKGISVLENETRNATLDDESILPPDLDFDVVFK